MTAAAGAAERRFPLFLGLAVAWLAATSWMRPLTLPDEGRYIGVAWEMLRSGDWLTPTLNGLPFFHKPPLFYWIGAGAMALFGPHEWAGRVPSLLGAVVAALAVALFARHWLGLRAAAASLWVLTTQPLLFVGAQFANLDMLVAGCITVAILSFAHVALMADRDRPAPVALVGGWTAAALGVLAKGLIGVLLPGLVLLAWLLATRRLARLRSLWSWGGAALFLGIALPWFVAMHLRHPEFLHYFVVVQHFQRYTAGGFNNAQPIWFFPLVLLGLGLPWSLWAWRLVRRRAAPDEAQASVRRLMLLWSAIVVAFFSLPQSKLVGYVLPAVPPLAVLIADASCGAAVPRLWRATAAVALMLCGGVVLALSVVDLPSSRQLALTLHAQRLPGEPVLFAGGYFYDLPLYARLDRPVPVVDDWADSAIAQRDNWRKELADAAAFAQDAGAAVLVGAEALTALPCQRGSVWVVATSAAAARYGLAQRGTNVGREGDYELWRLPPAPLNACPETPSAG